jgi:hypothetical protein
MVEIQDFSPQKLLSISAKADRFLENCHGLCSFVQNYIHPDSK